MLVNLVPFLLTYEGMNKSAISCRRHFQVHFHERKLRCSWWRHQMETFPRYWLFVRGIGEFPSQRPVTRSSDVSFDLRLNKRLGKQSMRRWFETPSHSQLVHIAAETPATFQSAWSVEHPNSWVRNFARSYKKVSYWNGTLVPYNLRTPIISNDGWHRCS